LWGSGEVALRKYVTGSAKTHTFFQIPYYKSGYIAKAMFWQSFSFIINYVENSWSYNPTKKQQLKDRFVQEV